MATESAPESQRIHDLAPVVVTANRTSMSLVDTAYTTHVVDSSVIEERNRRTLSEALQFIPGVLVQKTAAGHGSPFIRGFTGRQNLIMIDGVRMNNSLWRSGPVQYWNTIDSRSIERLELVKNQGSVLYGSDAIGGTANVFTKHSDFRRFAEGENFFYGSGDYEFRSNGDGSHVGRLESAFGVGGRYGLMLGITAKDFGDIRGSRVGLMENTGYTEQDFDLRFDMALFDSTTLTLAHQYVNQDDIWRFHSTVFNQGWIKDGKIATPGTFDSRIHDQERSLTYLRLAGETATSDTWIDRWTATFSYQTQDEREFQNRSATDIRLQGAKVDTYGFDLSLESEIGNGTLIYGFDYYHDEVNAFGKRDTTGTGLVNRPDFRPVADDSEYDLLGAFAQYVWRPNERLELTGGGRFTYAEAQLGKFFDSGLGVDKSASRNWNNVSGSLRALYHLNEKWSLYGGLSQAFRAPNLTDLSGNLTTLSGTPTAGNVEVDPEKFLTYEIGTRFSTAQTYLNLSIYYTDIFDIITGVPATTGSGSEITSNGQNGKVYGVELEGSWRFHKDWTLSGFAAWQDGETETPEFLNGPTTSDTFSRMNPLSASLALRWDAPSRNYWVEGRVLAAAEQDNLSRRDKTDTQRIPIGGTPGYVVLMANAGWQVNDDLKLTLGLENLTNEDYRIHGSGQNEQGFGAIARAKLFW
ncbi:MAG: TonB-dependent receptor [Opitutales bacterium]